MKLLLTLAEFVVYALLTFAVIVGPQMAIDAYKETREVTHPPTYCITSDIQTGMVLPCQLAWKDWRNWVKDGDDV